MIGTKSENVSYNVLTQADLNPYAKTADLYTKQQICDMIYPVGSIVINMGSNPASQFGGVWEQISLGKTLVGVNPDDSDFSPVGKTGGAKTHKLTANEIPHHTHELSSDHSCHSWSWGGTGHTVFADAAVGQGNGTGLNTIQNVNNWTYWNSSTESAHNNLQPYLVVAIWKRNA